MLKNKRFLFFVLLLIALAISVAIFYQKGSFTQSKEGVSVSAQKISTTTLSVGTKPIIKKLAFLPKLVKSSASVNDTGTVTLKPKVSFVESLLPVAHALNSSRIFLYKSGQFPAQLFYYDTSTYNKKQLTDIGKEVYSASILDQVNSIIYTTKNNASGMTLRLINLDNPELNKVISTVALGPVNFSLGPDGKSLAYFEGDGNNNYLIIRDLSSLETPVLFKASLPSGVTNVAELTWSPTGRSIYLLKRDSNSKGKEAVIEFGLEDNKVNEIVPADSYKSLLSAPLADGKLFYLGLKDLTRPGNIAVVEKDLNTGDILNHNETLGATSYLVAPSGIKIYFHAGMNKNDPLLSKYDIVGFGDSDQEIIVNDSPICTGGDCVQRFYSYNTSSKTVKEIFTNQFGINTATPNDREKVVSEMEDVVPKVLSYPTIIYPNGGEILIWNQPASISWTPDSPTGFYDVFVKGVQSGKIYTVSKQVSSRATDKLSVSWVPIQENYGNDTNFIVRVCKSETELCADGAAAFSIPQKQVLLPPIVLYPNGGEPLYSTSEQYISWTPQNTTEGFDVYLVGETSGDKYLIKQSVPNAASDKISISWVPSSAFTTGLFSQDRFFRVRVCITGTTICGESQNYFTLNDSL
ncbi:MAG: hypothetical protein WCF94_03580 [bacterium]